MEDKKTRIAMLAVVLFLAGAIYLNYIDQIAKTIIGVAVVVSLFKNKMDWKVIREIQKFITECIAPDATSDTALASFVFFSIFAVHLIMLALLIPLYSIQPVAYALLGGYYLSIIYILFILDRQKIRDIILKYNLWSDSQDNPVLPPS